MMSEEYNKLLVGYQELQAQVKELEAIPRDEADGFNKIIAHYQQQAEDSAFDIEEVYKPQIESLQAQVKELEAALRDIVGAGKFEVSNRIRDLCRAALQENEL